MYAVQTIFIAEIVSKAYFLAMTDGLLNDD